MEEIKIFSNPDFGDIRTLIIEGEPWFVAKDISDKLGYTRTSSMTKQIDEEDRQIFDCTSQAHPNFGAKIRQIGIINESGLYAAIFGSTLENAKKFKKWVTSEVLPQIRKTGCYQNESLPKKINQDIPVGELARLSAVMDRIMVRQQSEPHDIARAFEMLCKQFGILLPENFVNIPKYVQQSLELKGGSTV